jgi:hypothetical protein
VADNDGTRVMEPLHHLLGDEIGAAPIATCRPTDQTILCYVLATSMLYLYPGPWLQSEWSSEMVYFIRQAKDSLLPMLTFPYVSVSLQSLVEQEMPSDNVPIHSDPVVLALGIVLLEIVAGVRIPRSDAPSSSLRQLKNREQAIRTLRILHKQKRTRMNRLVEIIDACLRPNWPANFPTLEVAGEGPIRYYILTCVVYPLAKELEDGHKINLRGLNSALLPEHEAKLLAEESGKDSYSTRSDTMVVPASEIGLQGMTSVLLLCEEAYRAVSD